MIRFEAYDVSQTLCVFISESNSISLKGEVYYEMHFQ